MTPAEHAALDEMTAALRDGTDDLALRLKAVLAHLNLNTASPRPVPRPGLAAAARTEGDGQQRSGRIGTSPVPGPAA